jgi:putative transposase
MARSRYVITEPDKPHFLTCTVMEWLPVFEHWRYSSARRYAGELGCLRLTGGGSAFSHGTLERPKMRSHAGAWER